MYTDVPLSVVGIARVFYVLRTCGAAAASPRDCGAVLSRSDAETSYLGDSFYSEDAVDAFAGFSSLIRLRDVMGSCNNVLVNKYTREAAESSKLFVRRKKKKNNHISRIIRLSVC